MHPDIAEKPHLFLAGLAEGYDAWSTAFMRPCPGEHSLETPT